MAIVLFRRWFVAALLLGLGLSSTSGYAHRLTPEVVAYFKADADRIHVLVRVPTAILGDARLPRRSASLLDLAAVDTRLGAVATEVIRNLDLTDDGRPLPGKLAAAMISVVGDRSFDRYDTAVAHLAGPRLPVDRPVYWDEAFVDLQLEYPALGGETRLSARLNGLSVGSDFVQTRAAYLPPVGDPRVVTITGPPQRVPFEPPLSAAVRTVVGQSLPRFTDAHLVWLLTTGVAVSAVGAGPAFAAAVVAQAAGFTTAAVPSSALSASATEIVLFVWAALVLAVAARVMVGGGATSLIVLGGLAGAAGGVWLGSRLQDVLPLGGSHRLASVAADIVVLTILAALLFAFLRPLTRATYAWRAPSWLITAMWVAIPAHEASHVMMRTGAALAAQDAWMLPAVVAALSTHAPLIATMAFPVVLWLITKRRRPLSAPGGAAS